MLFVHSAITRELHRSTLGPASVRMTTVPTEGDRAEWTIRSSYRVHRETRRGREQKIITDTYSRVLCLRLELVKQLPGIVRLATRISRFANSYFHGH